MLAPGTEHARAIMALIELLLPAVRRLGGELLTAPLDVFLPGAAPVEPDLLLLLPEQKRLASRRGVEGAPALVVEVLSPSNPRHDQITKRALYALAGVPEYWLVSPEAATIEVLVLEGEVYQRHLLAGGDDRVTSPLLPDLAFPASAVFR